MATNANNFTNVSICNSRVNTTKHLFIWNIDNFSLRNQKNGDCFESAILTSCSYSGNPVKLSLEIYPNGRSNDCDHVSLFIRLIEYSAPKLFAEIRCSIKDANGVERNQKVDKFAGFAGFTDYSNPGFNRFVGREELLNEKNGLLSSDSLTILCQITVYEEVVKCDKFDKIKVPECRLAEDVGNLYEKCGQFADCTIVIPDPNGKQFGAYKGILACRSRVFAAMFNHTEMLEAQKGIVIIEDVKAPVMEQILEFIYSDMASKLAEMPEDLLIAANKYELDRLKALCERELANSMDIANVCELLVLASSHEANQLKLAAIKFINLHINKVMKSDGWKMLVKYHLELLDEL